MRETSTPAEASVELPEWSDTEPTAAISEEIHLRNFDVQRSYDLRLRVQDGDDVAFVSRYRLAPGTTESVTGRLTPGEYTVTVVLDGHRRETALCGIDATPDRTALVEIGNGTVSITQGMYS